MNKEFKPGDKVYFPTNSTKIKTISYVGGLSDRPLYMECYFFTEDGKRHTSDAVPSLYHATVRI